MNQKIINQKNLLKYIKKNKYKKIGLTNGCFDLLHEGHIYNIKKCKSFCEVLIVAINSNKSVKLNKGDLRPIENLHERIANVSKLIEVDFVTYFNSKTPLRLISLIKPHILFKGSDYKNKKIIGEDIIKRRKGKVILIPLLKGYSTTNKIKNISKS